jgi:filamentous hemagglutinin family protein
MKNNKLRMAILAALYSGGAAGQQIQFDGFDGAGNGNDVVLNPLAGTYTILPSAGRLSANGVNLFHSFLRFNVANGETALFSADGTTGSVENIVARVSGGSVSNIDGTVRSGISSASLWLVNPAGIIVGATGTFDVTGTLALGAADSINFGGTQQWFAQGASGAVSALTVEPSAFGFLANSTAGTLQSNASLTAGVNSSLLLAGGDVTLRNAVLRADLGAVGISVYANDHLQMEGGSATVHQAGTVNFDGASVSLLNNGSFRAMPTPDNAGNIRVTARTGDLVVDRWQFTANSEGVVQEGGDILLQATLGNVDITGSTFTARVESSHSCGTRCDELGGEIGVLAGQTLTLTDTQITSRMDAITRDDQRANNVSLQGNRVVLDHVTISVPVSRPGWVAGDRELAGSAGTVRITSTGGDASADEPSIFITNGTVITSSTGSSSGSGNVPDQPAGQSAAPIILNAEAGSIRIENGTVAPGTTTLLQSTASGNSGQAGNLSISAFQDVTIDGAKVNVATSSENTADAAGSIDIFAGGTTRLDGAELSAGTTGASRAGSVFLNGASVDIVNGTVIETSTTSSGPAGAITIGRRDSDPAGRGSGLVTIDDSYIRSNSNQGAPAGDVTIIADGILITNQSEIHADYSSGAVNGPGTITIKADEPSTETSPADNPYYATTGVTRIVDSLVSANNRSGGADGRGNIAIGGGAIVIAGSRLTTDVEANGIGDDIAITGVGDVWIVDSATGGFLPPPPVPFDPFYRPYEGSGSLISAITGRNAGAGGSVSIGSTNGDVHIVRSAVDVTNHANNNINVSFPPTPSDISISALRGLVDLEGSEIVSKTTAVVDAGPISIRGESVRITGGIVNAATTGNMVTDTDLRGAGNAGDVTINTTGADPSGAALQISGGALISSDANNAVGGERDGNQWAPNAGTVVISAQNGSVDIAASNVSTGAGALAGDAGIVRVRADVDATIRDASTIDTTVRSDRYGAPAIISVDGQQSVHISSSVLEARTEGTTYAGDILVSAPTVVLDHAELRASSDLDAIGSAGAIFVDGGSLLLDSSTLSTSTSTAADAGIVMVRASGTAADALNIVGATVIESRADLGLVGTGGNPPIADAGTVRLIAQNGGIRIAGGATPAERATITTSVGNAGSAGSISFDADSVFIRNANITTSVDSLRLEGDQGDLEAAEINIASSGAIELEGAALLAETSGLVDAGQISLAGGSVSVTGGSISANTTNAGDAGSITLGANGAVTLAGGAAISTSSEGDAGGAAGAITMTAGSVTTTSATISTSIDSQIAHAAIAQILIDSAGATSLGGLNLRADTSGATTAGSITIESDGALTATGGTWTAETTGTQATAGNGGSLAVRSAGAAINGVNIRASTSGQGDAGSLTVTSTGALTANGGEWVAQTTGTAAGSGAGGSISLNGTSMGLTNLNLAASTAGPGLAGSVIATSAGTINVSGGNWTAATTGTAAGSGNGGSFDITGASVTLTGVQVVASTAGRGHAGNIEVVATGSGAEAINLGANTNLRSEALGSSVAGNAGSIAVDARNGGVTMSGAVLRTSAAATAGHAGTIDIMASRNVRLTNTTATTTVASALAPLPAEINVHAGGTVEFLNTDLSANTSGAAAAGSIDVTGSAILISEGSSLSSNSTGGSGAAGSICVYTSGVACPASAVSQVGGVMALAAPIPATGGITIEESTLSTLTTGSGNAGSIHVLASGPVTFMNGDVISESRSTTSTPGNAPGVSGSINIDVGANSQLAFLNGSQISTDAAAADGGTITVNAANSAVEISDSRIRASAGEDSNGGNVVLNDFGDTIMRRSFIFARAESGNGGTIDVLPEGRTGLFLRDTESAINADSDAGNDGDVNISSPDTDIDSAIQKQDAELNAAPVLVSSTCAAAKSERSTLVREARGTVTESPDGYLGAAVEVPATRTTQTGAEDSPRLAVNIPAASTTGGCL